MLVDGPGWRWIFFVNLPIGMALIWLTLRQLPESRDSAPRRLDLAGMGTFAGTCLLATYALIRGNEDGWTSASILAARLAVAFLAAERRSADPMLPPHLFRIPAFTGTALVAFAQSIALYPLLLFLALYVQETLGLSATDTGLRMLPLTVVLFVVAPISGKLTSRMRLRLPLGAGLLPIGTSLLLMRAVSPTSDWTALLPGLIVGGLAIGTISPAVRVRLAPKSEPWTPRAQGWRVTRHPTATGRPRIGTVANEENRDRGAISALVLSHAHDVQSGILDTTAESFDLHVAVNARASLLLIAAFARQVPAEGGAIVALTSDHTTGNLPYGASKVRWTES